MENESNINSNREEWVDKVMASTNGMQRAEAPADLYDQVMLRMNNPTKAKNIPFPTMRWAAAALLLLAVNVGSVLYASSLPNTAKQNTTNSANPLASEIFSGSTYNY